MKQAPVLFACLLLVSFTSSVFSQDLQPKSVASPEVAALGKFGDIPIGYYTGTADLSINLHTIEQDGVRIPITLKYHSSGIHVEQESTIVGLGFDLSVGGNITQVFVDLPDQENSSYFEGGTYYDLVAHAATIDSIPLSQYKAEGFCFDSNCSNGSTKTINGITTLRDFGWASPDRFTFNVPSGSGEFRLDQVTQTPILSGNKSKQFYIQRTASSDVYKPNWTITDTDGNIFYFNTTDYETSTQEFYSTRNGATGKLSYVKTPSGSIINFRYKDGLNYSGTYTQSEKYDFYVGASSAYGYNSIFDNAFSVKYLSEIETEHEKIVFELSTTASERQDLRATTLTDGYGARRINAIHIWDKTTNKKIKSFNFAYDYFGCDQTFAGRNPTVTDYLTKRLKLLSVTEVGYNASGIAENGAVHSFDYDETHPLPRKDSYARDHWGYFNGKNNSSFLSDLSDEILSGIFPSYQFFGTTAPDYVLNWFRSKGTANKGMDPNYAKSGLLTKITYPTKGSVTLEYEANRYKNIRTLSAAEMDSDLGHHVVVLADLNTSNNTVQSSNIQPQQDGFVYFDDFHGAITKIDQSIPDSKFANCWVGIYRVGNATALKEWRLSLNGSGGYNGWQIGPEYVQLPGATSDQYYVKVFLEDISELTPQGGSQVPVASVSISFSYRDQQSSILNMESIGGGMRVKSMQHYDPFSGITEKSLYTYTSYQDSTATSGKLMGPVRTHSFMRYIYNPTPTPALFADVVELASYSYSPLSGDAQGAVVGYDRVEVSRVSQYGNLGKTVNYYRNKPSSSFPYSSFGSFTKSLPNIPYFDNGLLDSSVVFTSGKARLKKTINTYTNIETGLVYNLNIFNLQYGSSVTDSSCGCSGQTDPGEASLVLCNGVVIMRWMRCGNGYFIDWLDDLKKWLAVYRPVKTKWYELASSQDIIYGGSNALQSLTTTSYRYNPIGQTKRKSYLNSKGETKISFYKHPYDETNPSSIVQTITGRKQYDLLLEEIDSLNQSQISRLQNNYQVNYSGNVTLLNVKKSSNAASLYDVVTNVTYDNKDNILQYEKNGIITSYQWGYAQAYPVVKVDNASTTLQVNNTTSTKQLSVLKTSGTQQPFSTTFTVGRSGNATLALAISGAPNTNETATISYQITGNYGLSAGYSFSSYLCMGTGTLAGSCNVTTATLNGLVPGDYTLTGTMTYENGVSIGNGRIITINYPDISLSFTGSEFYYQNYEDNGTDGSSHTGKKYSTSASVSWTKPNTRKYVISYWYRQSGVWKFSPPADYTGPTFTMAGGDAYDDVRIHPKDGLMTTYTFEPSIGMTSMTDAAGMTTYFEFDSFARFKLARDANNNIIKNFVYNYKQSVP
jgi:hypothetical protein